MRTLYAGFQQTLGSTFSLASLNQLQLNRGFHYRSSRLDPAPLRFPGVWKSVVGTRLKNQLRGKPNFKTDDELALGQSLSRSGDVLGGSVGPDTRVHDFGPPTAPKPDRAARSGPLFRHAADFLGHRGGNPKSPRTRSMTSPGFSISPSPKTPTPAKPCRRLWLRRQNPGKRAHPIIPSCPFE
jgi:hypothetical protein